MATRNGVRLASGSLTQPSRGERQRRPGRAADGRRAGPKGRSPRRMEREMRRRFRNIAAERHGQPTRLGYLWGPPMSPHPSRLLIVAVSGRALAQSAGRAGYRPVVLDLFADQDTRAASSVSRRVNVPGTLRIDPGRLLETVRRLAPGAGLVYGSGFEGRPALLEQLSRGRALYGNTPATVRSVRDPARFFPLL